MTWGVCRKSRQKKKKNNDNNNNKLKGRLWYILGDVRGKTINAIIICSKSSFSNPKIINDLPARFNSRCPLIDSKTWNKYQIPSSLGVAFGPSMPETGVRFPVGAADKIIAEIQSAMLGGLCRSQCPPGRARWVYRALLAGQGCRTIHWNSVIENRDNDYARVV